ncbi:anaerobic sulfite reductase subunit AsrB [Candidatus Woesearchaeota archaeon]|nr:anaerobic sulfite reductase subunit AsrB [Candidatus Woesearchaeota archaeon]
MTKTLETKPYVIESKQKECEGIYLFRLKTPGLKYLPGQFFQVWAPAIGEAPISVASFEDDYLEMLIRDVGDVTKALCKLNKGDKLHLRGPYGTGYPMQWFENNQVIIIGGGTGVAPVRGVAKYVQANPEKYKGLEFFFGFRCPKDILMKQDIKEWQKECKVNLTVDKKEKGWNGPVGFVPQLLEKSTIDNKQKIVALCGPPVMINKCIEVLKTKGFNEDQLYVSLERHMKCGTGKCGHCMVQEKYVCCDGPVFRYDKIKHIIDE